MPERKRASVSTTLRRFNQRAELLENSRFLARIRDGGLGQHVVVHQDRPPEVTRRMPEMEDVQAFLSNLRLFLLERDGLSFSALHRLYVAYGLPEELVGEVGRLAADVEDFLDAVTPVEFQGLRITRRRVFQVFAYGWLSHLNPEKADEYEEWRKRDLMFSLLEVEFIHILLALTQAAYWLRQANLRALEHLGAA